MRPSRSKAFSILFMIASLLATSLAPASAQTTLAGTGFMLTSLGNRQVRITWQSGTGQASFRLDRRTSQGYFPVNLGPNATNYTDSLPLNVPVVCYQLYVLDAEGSPLLRSFMKCFLPYGGYAMNFS